MGGLLRIARLYGGIKITNKEGQTELYCYDYHIDDIVKEKDFTAEMKKLSEKAKRKIVKKEKNV